MTTRAVHVLTPGDHYSARTGSATATVVHGLSSHRPAGAATPVVLVARGTYPDRYASAQIVEYDAYRPPRFSRYADAALSRVGARRYFARRSYAAALSEQRSWPEATVVGHNAIQLIDTVDTSRHRAVLYAHNSLFRTYGQREAARCLEKAAAIIAVSDHLAGDLASSLPASLHERIRVVKNGVDTQLFRPGESRDDGTLRVVFVGRVIPAKGVDVLLDSVLRLNRPDIDLTIIGSAGFDAGLPQTEYERRMRAGAAKAGERIRVLPFMPRQQLAAALSSADVVVVPSRWAEPFALTVLEGMASGAAVIGTMTGGIPESVAGAGILVPPDDVEALAEAIEGLADDRALLARTRSACLAYARTQSWSAVSTRFYQVLSSFG